jgi:prepilin signal peptidase PulO-like enzyme (type II secretory pathway)
MAERPLDACSWSRTVGRVSDPIFLTYVLAVIGAALGVPLARFAAHRATHQPVSYDIEAERRIFEALETDPALYLRVIELQTGDFADSSHRDQWAALQQRYATIAPPDTVDSEAAAELWIASQWHHHRHLFTNGDGGAQAPETDVTAGSLTKSIVIDAESVVAAAQDRNVYNGRSPIVDGDKDGPILVRRLVLPGTLRIALTVIMNAASWALAPWLAQAAATSTISQLFVIAAVCVLASASLLWALVDIDTMYLDTPTFWPGAIIAWGLAIGAAVADYEPSRIVPGVLIALGGAAVFELANLGYRIVRGTDGMGGGDTLILLATAGVPAALFGSWSIGYYAALGSLILGVVGWFSLFIAGRVTRTTPYAFGPYLALGWLGACLLWVVTQ